MELGISVEQVIKAKFGPYLDSLPKEEAEKKLKEYVDTAKDSIQWAIDEASGLGDSIQSTCTGIATQTPIIISQIAGVAGSIDPAGKVSQLATIATTVSGLKDQVKRASAQLGSMSNIITQLGVDIPILGTLNTAIQTASTLLSTIPV